ncbi:MAG: lysophospholipid transporter LplT [Hylemonella sp.]|nr:lysophospholipid transporter LplT [Hylemonella sp.]
MSRDLPRGFGWLMATQFLSSLADNALLIVTIAHLHHLGAPLWWAPLLKFAFTLSYVLFAPFIGALADAVCKRRLMAWMNGLKLLGALALLYGLHPMLAFALVGLGASVYAPAKYGLLTESVRPAALVAANGWVESTVVLSVLLGTVLGGVLIAPLWLGSSPVGWVAALWPVAAGASSPALNVSLLLVVGLYLLSALCNLGIVPSGRRYPARDRAPLRMLDDFRHANGTLWRDRSGGLSLAVTTAFWGVGAMLQFAVLHWAVQGLGLSLDQAAYLQAIVAIGVVAGAVLVASRLRLRHATSVLPLGLLMGGLIALSVWVPHWTWAVPSLLLIGTLGGMLVVPMNALLQHRGHRLLTAGQSIAVQGFNENLSVLVMLGLYAGLIALQVPVQIVMVLAGLGLAVFIGRILWRRRAAPVRLSLLSHLLRRD